VHGLAARAAWGQASCQASCYEGTPKHPRAPTLESPPVAVLLTGVGYIGATLLGRLAPPIVALDNFYSTPREAIERVLPNGARFVEGDVADAVTVARAFDLLGDTEEATVYHLAAQPSAAMAAREPEVTERSNLVGARVVLEAARERGAQVVFASSFRVYGDELVGQSLAEDTPYGRVSDLSHLSKIYVEQLARMIGVRFVSVRLGVTYGLSPIMKTAPAFMTVPNLFCQRAAHGEVLQVLEDRPMAFIHVADAAEALLAASRIEMDWSVANAAPEVATIGQLARTVQRLAQERCGWVRIHGAASSEAGFRVTSRLGGWFEPRRTLAEGLGQVLDFFLEQERR
jgi:UDP-glucose 4-epimerase